VDSHRSVPVVAIVGAGFSGTMTAVHLLRGGHEPLEVVLIDADGRFGPGVAYRTLDEGHLLNVPAELMSAFCEQPLHFSAWIHRELGRRGPAEFIGRTAYGSYLESILTDTERQLPHGRRLTRIKGRAIAASPLADGILLDLADGSRQHCDRLVLALGASPGESELADRARTDDRIVVDPWTRPLPATPTGETTLVLGMGLTAVDQILSATAGVEGEVVAVSRGGRFPSAHLSGLRPPAPPPPLPEGPLDLAALEAGAREHLLEMTSRGYDWRDVVDGIRPVSASLWGRLSATAQEDFVAKRSRFWERCRHRMAPLVGGRLARLATSGRLTTFAGEITRIDGSGRRLRVELTGDSGGRMLLCSRIVCCTGAGTDIRHSTNPLLRDLIAKELVVPDHLGLGLRADADGTLLDGPQARLAGLIHGLGPLRRGELWETTAVGEIRVQARDLARAVDRAIRSSLLPLANQA
jgi:uncharacterized NAD(P)/FAD-binding protein YdhS